MTQRRVSYIFNILLLTFWDITWVPNNETVSWWRIHSCLSSHISISYFERWQWYFMRFLLYLDSIHCIGPIWGPQIPWRPALHNLTGHPSWHIGGVYNHCSWRGMCRHLLWWSHRQDSLHYSSAKVWILEHHWLLLRTKAETMRTPWRKSDIMYYGKEWSC